MGTVDTEYVYVNLTNQTEGLGLQRINYNRIIPVPLQNLVGKTDFLGMTPLTSNMWHVFLSQPTGETVKSPSETSGEKLSKTCKKSPLY